MNFLAPCLPARFWNKVIPEPNSGCWLWLGASTKEGYSRYRHEGKLALGHRVTFSIEKALNPNLVLDHIRCRTPSCVNPMHVEQVPQRLNAQRNYRSARTRCSNGHLFDEANTYRTPDGRRRKCRRCHADEQAACKKRRLSTRNVP